MWWLETFVGLRAGVRPLLAAGLMATLAASAGCTVRPLYANPDSALGSSLGASSAAALSTVAVDPVTTRYAQEVRNHLIFLFGGGKGQPAQPSYRVKLAVSRINEASASIQVETDEEPTAAAITLVATYSLTDTQTGAAVATGTRQIMSSYDVPRQEFAVLRAQRDAENRAARELAEVLRLAIAQDLLNIASVPKSAK